MKCKIINYSLIVCIGILKVKPSSAGNVFLKTVFASLSIKFSSLYLDEKCPIISFSASAFNAIFAASEAVECFVICAVSFKSSVKVAS